jgi:hypothetical protein
MAKTLLSMADLRARALTEIRHQPGCSSVRDIAINHVTDHGAESNWSHALRRDYNLITD